MNIDDFSKINPIPKKIITEVRRVSNDALELSLDFSDQYFKELTNIDQIFEEVFGKEIHRNIFPENDIYYSNLYKEILNTPPAKLHSTDLPFENLTISFPGKEDNIEIQKNLD